jgi:DNA-binding NarL/FixJ family response regulator
MDNARINIGIIEPSCIVFEGISNILLRSEHHVKLFKFNDLDEISTFFPHQKLDLVIINPSHIQNRIKGFKAIKNSENKVYWLGLVYHYFDAEILALFDESIGISDSPESILNRISALINHAENINDNETQEQLSERETDVLIQLVQGLSNKEIADKLNISIHTVISHRKNISNKTGIKSQAGLTIYAITKKIISLDSYQ